MCQIQVRSVGAVSMGRGDRGPEERCRLEGLILD